MRYFRSMRVYLFLILASLAAPAGAEPRAYALEPEISTVAFFYTLSGERRQGRMPVRDAKILLDLDNASASRVEAVLAPDQANAGLSFATDAMRSESVLNTRRYPSITFKSSRVTETATGAFLEGDITIRGVTRPIRLTATVFRQRGTERGDRRRLSILMTGTISRRDFGAVGFPRLVGDRIELKILTRIRRIN